LISYLIPFNALSTIPFLDSSSGGPTYTCLLNLLKAARSSYLGRLVAPIRITLHFSNASNWMRNSVLRRLVASLSDYDLAVRMESISSIKTMDGAVFLADSNIFFSIF
jgi:hypothetical protein